MARKLAHVIGVLQDHSILASIEIGEEIRQFMIDVGGNYIARQILGLLHLVTLEPEGLANTATRLMVRNILGILRQLGPVRSIVSIMVYLLQGNNRNVKAYLLHFLDSTLTTATSERDLDSKILLATSCLAINSHRKGLTPERIMKLWRPHGKIKKELKWAQANLKDDPEHNLYVVVGRLCSIEQGIATVTTAEIAFALDRSEDEIVDALKYYRAL